MPASWSGLPGTPGAAASPGMYGAAPAGGAGVGELPRVPPPQMSREEKFQLLLLKLRDRWGFDPEGLAPAMGTTRGGVLCPQCGGGSSAQDQTAFSVTVEEDQVLWHCFRATCGFSGRVDISGGRDGDSSLSQQTASALRSTGMFAERGPAGALAAQPAAAAQPQPQQTPQQQQRPAARKLGLGLQPLTPDLVQWFRQRGISEATLQRNGIAMEHRWCGALGTNVPQIAFPFRRDGSIVNIKYRALPKHFSQSAGGEQIFFGFDDAKGAQDIIIVEGEMDKLSVEEALAGEPAFEAGQLAVLSVPSGAPSRTAVDGAGPTASLERKFRYVQTCGDVLAPAQRIVLAVDADGPGVVLSDELARRLGRERCWRVTWPTGPHDSLCPAAAAAAAAGSAAQPDARDWVRKDANEVLVQDGPQVLRAYLEAAQPLPVRGLFRFDDFWPQVYDLYTQGPRGLSWGVSTGWASVDSCYKVVPGELTVVTGLPNSGKSEWLDALAVNLAVLHEWRLGLCSLENSAKDHARKLMEKYTGKPFFQYSRGEAAPASAMTFDDMQDALVWIDTHMHMIRPPPDTLPSVDYILDKARAAVMRYGITGLIIDPYNELDHRRPSVFTETEHVSRLLTKIKRFAQHYDVHVWFVAHPRTQRGFGTGGGTDSLGAPSMYDISGSANFINKADNGIVVHRPPNTGGGDEVQVLVRKVRNKLAGRIGDVRLSYDRITGRYIDDLSGGEA